MTNDQPMSDLEPASPGSGDSTVGEPIPIDDEDQDDTDAGRCAHGRGFDEPCEDCEDDGRCLDCGATFRFDDTGGYNPPCNCGANCWNCCEHGRCYEDNDEPDKGNDPEEDDHE